MKSFQFFFYSCAFYSIVFLISGCGGGTTSSATFDGKKYTVVSGTALSQSATSMSGVGSFVFDSPLLNEANSYRLTFSLSDSGILSFVTHSSNTLTNGVTLKFTRSGSTLTVQAISGSTTKDISSKFTSVDASKTLTYQIDFHNNESPAHVLFWNSDVSSFTSSTAMLNSEESDDVKMPGKGTGTSWGFSLTNATLTSATLGDKKFTD